jgi:hypothetical protein
MNSEDEAQDWGSIYPFPNHELPEFSMLERSGRKIGNASWFTQLRPGLIGLGPMSVSLQKASSRLSEGVLCTILQISSENAPATTYRMYINAEYRLCYAHGRQPLGIIVKCG